MDIRVVYSRRPVAEGCRIGLAVVLVSTVVAVLMLMR